MSRGKLRKLFPGGNTAYGFYSFFDHLAGPEADWRFILKGGPGVGKSTFMRRIGETMLDKGYDVEFFCCSSDNDSLDGVAIPALGVALLDGTAPHVVDPVAPGATDEIINLGDYWDRARLWKSRRAIQEINREIARLFDLAYKCLAHAKLFVEEIESYYAGTPESASLRRLNQTLTEKIFGGNYGTGEGLARHLFASAITPRGVVNHLASALGGVKRQVVIRGANRRLRASLVEKVYREALDRGYYVEAFHCGLLPECLEHLLIPGLDAAVITSNRYHPYTDQPDAEVLELEEMIEARVMEPYCEDLREATEELDAAIHRAVGFLNRAKRAHDALEEHYIPGMDFRGIDALRERITERILARARSAAGGDMPPKGSELTDG